MRSESKIFISGGDIRVTTDEQLEEWVEGKSVHNDDLDQCCPDFSCCQTHYKASPEERRLFRDRPDIRDQMLMMFLAAALSGYDIHVAGTVEGTG